MITKLDKNKVRKKRHARVRVKVQGTPEVPRLNVYRSNTNIYAQIIDDTKGVTLAQASSLKLENVSPLLVYKDAVIIFMGAGDVQKFEFAYEQLLSSTSPTQN